jgi:TIR domain
VGGIFISYRRADDHHAAGRLLDSLTGRFSADQIFFDIDDIEPGLRFMDVVRKRIEQSDVMLVVIGPNWVNSRDGHRLDDPADFVRLEVEAGLQLGIRVVPVLIDGAAMPKASELPKSIRSLVSLHAVTVNHVSFQRDAEYLNSAVAKILPTRGDAITGAKGTTDRWRAEFVHRSFGHFYIRLWGFGEEHRLELAVRMWHLIEKLRLDGKMISWTLNSGEWVIKFKLDGHRTNFKLTVHSTVLNHITSVLLFADDNVILSEK